MRIQSVRFRNLNSLRGEWMIDFTNQAYLLDGIFVITGGSGRTTILDAVCLALYGRPRLKEAAEDTGAIMSGQAGECFAEVTFETALGRYRAFWGQHRAHKKEGGALQPPRHEIADADTGEVLEARGRDVVDKIKETTGLSFDRFVQSILPAQDEFAAFLRCEPKERSLILERMTGTDIYSQLHKRAQEIKDAERVALSLAEAELAGFKSIGADEKEALDEQLKSLREEALEAGKNLARYGTEREWLSNMDRLQKELDALEDRRRDLTRRQEGFDLERARLMRAQKALEFGSAHAGIVTLRREQEAEKNLLSECHAKLPALETNVRRSEEALQLAVSALSEKQSDQKSLLELLRRVRELDLKQKEKESPIKDFQAAAGELVKMTNALKDRLEAEQVKFEAAQVQMRDIRKFFQDNSADERLVEQFEGIKTRFDVLCSFLDKRRLMGEERSAAEKHKRGTQKRLDGQSVLFETAKAKFTSLENSIKRQNGALSEILGSRSIEEWRETLSNLKERRVKLERIEEELRQRENVAALWQERKGTKDALASSQRECLKKIAVRREKIQALEKELRHLNVQKELILRIKDLEEARERLTDGQPCPLCGSTAHPYVAGNMPQEDEIRFSARRVEGDLKKEFEALSALDAENSRLTEEILNAESDEARFQAQVQDMERRLTEDLTTLQLSLPMDVEPLAGISMERQRSEELLQKTRLSVERSEKGEELLRSTKYELELAHKEKDQLASTNQEAEFEKEKATREVERITKEIRLNEDELKNIRLDLTRQVMPFGFKSIPEERPEQVMESLLVRLDRWLEQSKLRIELEKRLSVWERDLHHERAALDKLNLELKEKNETAKKLRSEKDALRQQRVSLFGGKDPDKEEVKQNALVEAAEKQAEAKSESRALVLRELADMRSRMEDLVKSIHIRADSLQKAEISFKKQLIANDFGNEDAYLSACLPESERKVLQERASALDIEQSELDAMQMDRKFTLEELRRQYVTDLTLLDAVEMEAQAVARLKELRQSIGSLAVRLEEEERLSSKRTELSERVERQTIEFRRWEGLYDLISSPDAQKDNKFTQSLVFEMVIRNANRQLQKMNYCYFLVTDEERPFSFDAIDKRCSGKRSSTPNLSCGENFIVSLALALGFLQMEKAGVDSIFLESGYWDNMDEEALGIALSALAGLGRDGKLIGIISDAKALKERVAAQIEVIPQKDGSSLIKAPGCVGNLD